MPPPVPLEGFGPWQGFNQFGPRPHAAFGERMPFICEEKRWSPPRPKRKQKLQLIEIKPSGEPEALLSKSCVPRMKRKAPRRAHGREARVSLCRSPLPLRVHRVDRGPGSPLTQRVLHDERLRQRRNR